MSNNYPVPAPITALPPSAFSFNFPGSLSFPPSSSSTLKSTPKPDSPKPPNDEPETQLPAMVYSCPKKAKRARSEEDDDVDEGRPSRRRKTEESSQGASSSSTGSVPSSSAESVPSGMAEIRNIRSIPVVHIPPSRLAHHVETNIVTDMATLFPHPEQARAIRRLWRKLPNAPDPTDQQEPIENFRVYIGYQARKALYTVRVFDKAQKPVLVRNDASSHSDNLEDKARGKKRDTSAGLLTPDEFPVVLYALDHKNTLYRRIRLSRPTKESEISDGVEEFQAQWVCPATTRWQVWYEPGRTKASEFEEVGDPEFLCEFGGMTFVRLVDVPIKRFTQEKTLRWSDKTYW
ncbi:hypothetical protein CYLTODRAFT_489728 [Cylindrobasidium torrendii FP15055 ss-10]|uniref:Uncharacterized protein n=1 Tax=Cylindrobasidium torrendii FP15055 ss-10 TaxID=1314674 RepID=A0A0D7BEB6_9AGAR|nr:hypothetical protein CYLTODRAFT_489728 [Cylindrobasidium torrendii FP15055 ss-10]